MVVRARMMASARAVFVPSPMPSREVGQAVAVAAGGVPPLMRRRAVGQAVALASGAVMTRMTEVDGGTSWQASACRRCPRCRVGWVLGCGECTTGSATLLNAPTLMRRCEGPRRRSGSGAGSGAWRARRTVTISYQIPSFALAL